MTWTHCHNCPTVQACAEADGCQRSPPIMTLDELTAYGDAIRREHAARRFAAIAFRAFWRSLWRSLGWCVPIVAAIEFVASRHLHT